MMKSSNYEKVFLDESQNYHIINLFNINYFEEPGTNGKQQLNGSKNWEK